MKVYKDINPLSVVNDVLIQAAEWKLAPEVVLLALKIVKQNPDIDEATAMLIARDEWDIISKGERPLSKAEQESLDADKLTEEDVNKIQYPLKAPKYTLDDYE